MVKCYSETFYYNYGPRIPVCDVAPCLRGCAIVDYAFNQSGPKSFHEDGIRKCHEVCREVCHAVSYEVCHEVCHDHIHRVIKCVMIDVS